MSQFTELAERALEEFKSQLTTLSLLFLGQHLWSLRIETHGSGKPSACLCRGCDEARKAHQSATGLWPTREQEHAAMEEWGGTKLSPFPKEEKSTTDPQAVAEFICDRYGPLSAVAKGGERIGVDASVIAHHIRDGVPVEYVDKRRRLVSDKGAE